MTALKCRYLKINKDKSIRFDDKCRLTKVGDKLYRAYPICQGIYFNFIKYFLKN